MNFKLSGSKALRILICAVFIFTSVFSTGIASAATGPVLTSAVYNVGTGSLTLTGTGFTQTTGLKNDITATKIIFTDGNLNVTPLTSATQNAERTSDTAATLTVGAADAGALAKWMVDSSTAASYKIEVMAGWNGTTSQANLSGVPVTISGMPKVTDAAYDYVTGKLTIRGTDLVSIPGAKNDILPKYLMMSDNSSNLNALTSSASVDIAGDKKSAVIILSAADKLALETFINSSGTVTLGGDTYKLYMTSGWNGPSSMGNMQGVAVTVSNWLAPVATTGNTTTTVKGVTTTNYFGKSSKAGSLYLVNSASFTGGTTTKADLDGFVADNTALVAPVTSALIGKPVNFKIANLVMTSSTGAYCYVAVDAAGGLSFKSATFTINNTAAPSLAASVSAGTDENTVVINATAGDGNSLMYRILTTSTASFVQLAQMPSNLIAYTPGTGILGVTSKNYVEVFEVNSSNQIVKFKRLPGTTSKLDVTPPTITSSTYSGAVITVNFSENVIASGAGATVAWSTAWLNQNILYSQNDGTTFSGLYLGNLAPVIAATTISGASVKLTFNTASSSSKVIVKFLAKSLKDASGNGIGDLVATVYDRSGFTVGTPISTGTLTQSGTNTIYNIPITLANDINGSPLTGMQSFTTTSSKDGYTVVSTSGSVLFSVGNATLPVEVSTTGNVSVLVYIASISTTKSSATITIGDASVASVGTIISTGGAAEGFVNYDIPVTGAKDVYGVLLNGSKTYTVQSTQQGSGVNISGINGLTSSATFDKGAATLHVAINRAGTQVLSINIDGVSAAIPGTITNSNLAGFRIGTPISDQQLNGVGYLKSNSITYTIPITSATDALGNLLNGSATYTIVTTSSAPTVTATAQPITFTQGVGSITLTTISTTGANNVSIHIDGIPGTKSAATIMITGENKAISASLPAGSIISGTGVPFTYTLTVNANDYAGIGFNGSRNLDVIDSGSGQINVNHLADFSNGTAYVPISFSTSGAHVITISSTYNHASITKNVDVLDDASASYTAIATSSNANVAVAGTDNILINLSKVHFADGTTVSAQTVKVHVVSTASGTYVDYNTVFDPSGNAQISFAAVTSSAYIVSFINTSVFNDTAHTITSTVNTGTVAVTEATTAYAIAATTAAIVVNITLTSRAYDVYGVKLEGIRYVTVTSPTETCFSGNVVFHDGLPSTTTPILATMTKQGQLTVKISGAVGANGQTTPTFPQTLP